MKKIVFLFGFYLPLIVWAQPDSIRSGIYSWKNPGTATQKDISSTTLFEGKVHDMEWLQMSANAIKSTKQKIKKHVPGNEEHLVIVKTGNITLMIKDSTWTIGAGSLALLMPGEKYTIQNNGTDVCNFYEMKYRSKAPIDLARAENAGGSLVSNWNNIAFISNNNGGGRRNFFNRPSAMSKKIEIHVTTLKEGVKSHEPHRHPAEEIILVIDNKTAMQIDDQVYKGEEGSIYYLGTNILHGIKNDGIGTCTYFAIQFE